MIAIAVFAFNRPHLLQRTLTALAANDLADKASLTIFCDGPRHEQDVPNTRAVRALARKTQGFASLEVVERSQNLGCADATIEGLKEMFRLYDRCIVIEDDILTSPYTLRYLTEGLARYEDTANVFNIAAWTPPHTERGIPAGYPYDVYAIPRFNCWGWASWKNRFHDIDWNVSDYDDFKKQPSLRADFNSGGDDLSAMLDAQMEKIIDTWDIRADYARFKKHMLGINPVRSYTLNIGIGSGTHTTSPTSRYDSDISLALPHPRFLEDVVVNERIRKAYHAFYDPPSLPQRALRKLRKLLHLS